MLYREVRAVEWCLRAVCVSRMGAKDRVALNGFGLFAQSRA